MRKKRILRNESCTCNVVAKDLYSLVSLVMWQVVIDIADTTLPKKQMHKFVQHSKGSTVRRKLAINCNYWQLSICQRKPKHLLEFNSCYLEY